MEKWDIEIINKTENGYLVMSPNGDTHYMTKDEYSTYLENRGK